MNIRKYYGFMLLAMAASLSAECCRFEVDSLKADLLEIKELVGLMVETPALDGFISGAIEGDAEAIKAALQDAVACVAAAKDVLTDEQIVAYANKLEAYWAELGEVRAPRPPFVDPAEGQLAPNELTYFPRDVFIARNLEVGGDLTVDGDFDLDSATISFIDNTNAASFQCLIFKKSRAGNIVQNGDTIGCLNFEGFDGSQFISGALLEAQVDGAPGVSDMPGRFVFLTTPDGSATPTEKMRINNAGLVTLTNNLDLPATTSASTGVISKAGSRFAHTFGTDNTFYGVNSGNFSMTGFGNTGFGTGTLSSLTTGPQNVAVGTDALGGLTTGGDNTVVGYQAGISITTGSDNVAIGGDALGAATTPQRNVVVGRGAIGNTGSQSDNVAIGFVAANSLGGASAQNVIIGEHAATNAAGGAFSNVTLANTVTIVGSQSSVGTASGLSNVTAIGYRAFCNGNNSTAVGANATAGFTNSMALGFDAFAPASNSVRVGNTAITVIQGQVAFTFPSDERIKSNIVDSPFGLAFIKNIRPIMYDKQCGENSVTELGFSAQNVEKAAQDLGLVFPGVTYMESQDLYSMRYNDLFAPVVKAIQELSAEVDTLKADVAALEALAQQ